MRRFIPAVLLAGPVLLMGQSSSHTPDNGAAPAVAHGSLKDTTNDFTPLTVGQKVNRRALRLIEPVTLFTSAFSASVDQLRDSPPEWGEGAEGFAKRFGSSEGLTASHNIIALLCSNE